MISVEFFTLNTSATLEYDFQWAKRYSPEVRTFSCGKRFMNCEFCLFNLRPRKLDIVPKVFLLILKYSFEIVGYVWEIV